MNHLEFTFDFFERLIGSPINEIEPSQLTGLRVVEILWPLNEVFRPRLMEIRGLPYDKRFEAAADAAIRDFAIAPLSETWDNLAPAAWRVLLERYQQTVQLAIGFEEQGKPMVTIPSALPSKMQLVAVMLLWLAGKPLFFPVADRGSLELAVVQARKN